MANYLHLVPFIKKAEGGLSKNPADAASTNPVPDGSGYHTNVGVTWSTWCSMFGSDAGSIQRFYAMSDEDFGAILKKLYWDPILGDQINSQRTADMILDWNYNSGRFYSSADTQDILIHSFGQHIGEDGKFGPATIAAINAVDEPTLYQDLIDRRLQFFEQCVTAHPTNSVFLQGWKNRISALVAFEGQVT